MNTFCPDCYLPQQYRSPRKDGRCEFCRLQFENRRKRRSKVWVKPRQRTRP